MDFANLSPATRQELELWGQNLATSETEIYDSAPAEAQPVVVELLRANALRVYVISEADRHLKELVQRARAEGVSWRKIGHALGITGEAARLRYNQ
jgi:hypothetical protein